MSPAPRNESRFCDLHPSVHARARAGPRDGPVLEALEARVLLSAPAGEQAMVPLDAPPPWSAEVGAPAVVGRHLFYNNSAFDDESEGRSDDDAIAPGPAEASDPRWGKEALLGGQTPGFRNYSSYSRGINGIMVDIAHPAQPELIGIDDFDFLVGNSADLGEWSAAPAPQVVAVREAAGGGGSCRVTLIWADAAIRNCWLRVEVKATSRTGLAEPDVFCFGNAVGEGGDSEVDTIVNTGDRLAARANPRGAFNPAPIDFPYDYNRDRLVDSGDRLIAAANATTAFDCLKLTIADSLRPGGFTLLSRSPASVGASQGVTFDGTHWYTTGGASGLDPTIRKYDQSWNLVDSRDLTGQFPPGWTEMTGLYYHTDGKLYVAANNYDRFPPRSWVLQIDAETLSIEAVHELVNDYAEGCIRFNDEWWTIYDQYPFIVRYNDDWQPVGLLELQNRAVWPWPSFHGPNGIATVGEFVLINMHETKYGAPSSDLYRWDGASLVPIDRLSPPSPWCTQGLCVLPDGQTLAWAERFYNGAPHDHRVVITAIDWISLLDLTPAPGG